MGLESEPFFFVVVAIAAYGLAYWGYGKWYDRKVWRPDVKRTTPSHMYMDGVEFFPVSRYVLWGYQFKSVAALGPILGPFIGITYGWLPALLWIIFGNFFIGWLQDYGSIMLSVRKEGRSFGPITYEFTGAGGRRNLLAFVLFYLVIISAIFIFLVAVFWNTFPQTFVGTLGLFLTGAFVGQLLYRWKVNVFVVTGIGLALFLVSIYVGILLPVSFKIGNVGGVLTFCAPASACPGAGEWNVAVWALAALVILYLGAVLPLPKFIQPTNYIAFFPAYAAIIFILIGALVTPFVANVQIEQASGPFLFDQPGVLGPIWPILFVGIACGSISGWHSLVGSSSTSKQLDIETDAHPVGAGAMLSEGLLALASLAAYAVLTNAELRPGGVAISNFSAWVVGANKLTRPFLGVFFASPAAATLVLTAFFGLVLIIYALTVQALVTRFFRLVAAESFGQGRARALGNKHVATILGLVIPWATAVSGSWYALFIYFGGTNQLLAGLAIMLISIHLAKIRAPSKFTLIPATFMIITTLSALIWEAWMFAQGILRFYATGRATNLQVNDPIRTYPLFGVLAGVIVSAAFVVVGAALFLVGLSMAVKLYRSYFRSRAETRAVPAVAADGGGFEKSP